MDEKSERKTKQKEVVLNYLKSLKTHPTAEKVFQEAKKQLPKISLGTVYRILNHLHKKGEIAELIGAKSHWDADTTPHSHFVCQKCKRIIDMPEKFPALEKNKHTKVGTVKNYQIYFYGICKKCRKK